MLINANALAIPLANKSVHTIVTSPPYYGLRDYGVDGQIGLEVTPDEYIANLVEVFRECKRILRDDGTLWVNIGDSYASNGCYINAWMEKESNKDKHHLHSENYDRYADRKAIRGGEGNIKGKDLIGIPWMLAFALRADGWYLRQDIIWAKPNPMPESVKDRCTKSHEYIFLLSKSAKYYYDSIAIDEPSVRAGEYNNSSETHSEYAMHRVIKVGETRNKRDVWTVATKPYKGAHYATFNPDLIKPCILAGAPEGGIVFDPFVGSGTTVATAIQLGRKGIGIDLSFKYLQENAKVRVESAELPLLSFIEQ